jgi:hypothetical protein
VYNIASAPFSPALRLIDHCNTIATLSSFLHEGLGSSFGLALVIRHTSAEWFHCTADHAVAGVPSMALRLRHLMITPRARLRALLNTVTPEAVATAMR